MDIQGEKLLSVPRATVWRALNDPAVLQRCVPGCDTFEPQTDNRFRVATQISAGPVRARFAGKLELRDIVNSTSYALSFEGSGGVAGFGKGVAQVMLQDAGEGTLLRYTAQAQVGGRLAQVGARLIDGVTRRMVDDFFDRFARELAAAESPARPAAPMDAAAPRQNASTQVAAPLAAVPKPTVSRQSSQIAVIAAAVSATAAAVAVLAALFAVHLAH